MIDLQNIHKCYGRLDVLTDVSTTFRRGRISAVVGHNGAGKTTLIKMILGLVRPDAGEIRVNGRSVAGDCEYRRMIGYMPQAARFPENLNLHDMLDMLRDLRKDAVASDYELFEALALAKEAEKPFKNLSGGTRQKAAALTAFLFQPQILILDEPTAGLDPVASCALKDKILKEKSNGRTIVLTSHIMSDLEELADDVVLLVEGRVFYEGAVETLVRQSKSTSLERAIAHMMQGVEVWTALQKS